MSLLDNVRRALPKVVPQDTYDVLDAKAKGYDAAFGRSAMVVQPAVFLEGIGRSDSGHAGAYWSEPDSVWA